MHQDDEPLGAASLGSVTTGQGSVTVAGNGPHHIDEKLFEDILDLEGALRLTTQATAGLGAPQASAIEALGRNLPEPASSRLQELAVTIRTATKAGDIRLIFDSHLAVIDALATLRTTLWPNNSEY